MTEGGKPAFLRRVLDHWLLRDTVSATLSNLLSMALQAVGVALITFIVTGLGDLTFSLRSWSWFGWANAAGDPGSTLRPNAVYDMPVGARYRVADDMLLSVGRDYTKTPVATLTLPDGETRTRNISTSSSLSLSGKCETVSVHLMRQPEPDAQQFYVMYSTVNRDSKDCAGFWTRLFGGNP
ncbi:hypothetical protein [Paenirhodobacter sp.]|uniref:hypothetical protein n=1 Tax=Paenirhodobacter sp. TaxID=1965326 RepID=UPI003B3C0910